MCFCCKASYVDYGRVFFGKACFRPLVRLSLLKKAVLFFVRLLIFTMAVLFSFAHSLAILFHRVEVVLFNQVEYGFS